MQRNRMSFRDYAKPYFSVDDDGELTLRNVPVPPPDRFLAAELYRPKALDLLRLLWLKVENRTGRLRATEQRITTALMDEIITVSRADGAEPLLVYFPVGFETYSDRYSRIEDYFREFHEQREVRTLNIRPDFQAESEAGKDLGGVFHWNEQGHAVAARAIGDYLEATYSHLLRAR